VSLFILLEPGFGGDRNLAVTCFTRIPELESTKMILVTHDHIWKITFMTRKDESMPLI